MCAKQVMGVQNGSCYGRGMRTPGPPAPAVSGPQVTWPWHTPQWYLVGYLAGLLFLHGAGWEGTYAKQVMGVQYGSCSDGDLRMPGPPALAVSGPQVTWSWRTSSDWFRLAESNFLPTQWQAKQ